MAYTIDLLKDIRHRYMALATLHKNKSTQPMPDIRTLVDTGAFNTMIDSYLAEKYGHMMPIFIPVVIGGHSGNAQGCILSKLIIGDIEMERVFALSYPFKDWLARHIILGTNVMNNWDFTISRTDDILKFVERIPSDAPNQIYPYQNYFKNGEYVIVQNDMH